MSEAVSIYAKSIHDLVLIDDNGLALTTDHGRALTDQPSPDGPTMLDSYGRPITDGPAYEPAIHDARNTTFFASEVSTFAPDSGNTDVLHVSDLGYRTRPTDVGGVTIYPSLLDTAFELDRRVSLELNGNGTASYGSIRIINLNGTYDVFTLARNSDSRPVKIKIGQKLYDATRGIYVDPSYKDLQPVFSGSAQSWLLSEDAVEVPLKDATYLLDKPIQTRFYKGTGADEGGPELTGQPKPMTRGGTTADPIRNVPFKLVDTINNIWQWTDGLGTVVALYENNAPVFSRHSDTGNLYLGITPPGYYRTCNAKGLIQLGSTSVGVITGDVCGASNGVFLPTAAALAQSVLLNDIQLPAATLNIASFMYADIAYPYVAGFFLDSSSAASTTGLQIIAQLLASIGGRLLTSRGGSIGVFVLPRTDLGARPSVRLDKSNIVSVAPIALPTTLDPPPYRWQVAYITNYTVQATGFNPTIGDGRKQFIANQFRYAEWYSPEIKANWAKPNDPPPISTYLLRLKDAQVLADSLGDQWRTRPAYYQITVPIGFAAGLDIGKFVWIDWPLGLLKGGVLALIVGEQIRSVDTFSTFEVLVNTASLTGDPIDGSFTLDVSYLDVGSLGEIQGEDFILDASLLDVDVFPADLEVVIPPINPRNAADIGGSISLVDGTGFGSPDGFGSILFIDPGTGSISSIALPSGATAEGVFVLDVSFLDVDLLANDDGTALPVVPTDPGVTPDPTTSNPSNPVVTPPATTTPPATVDLTFILDQSLLDVGELAPDSTIP